MFAVLLLVSGIVIAVLVCWRSEKRRCEAFVAEFPPISDAEFLARCSPGTNPQVALKVRKIVAENLGVKYECIYPSSRFVEDLGAD